MTTWIVVADSSRARLFEETAKGVPLNEIVDFANPEGRAMNRELTSDAEGRYASKGEIAASHGDAADVGAVDHANDLFAKHIADYLEKARAQNRFHSLLIMAAPKFLGKLRASMDKELLDVIEAAVDKDISRSDARTVAAHMRKLRKGSGEKNAARD